MKAAESPMVLTASELEFFACEERILINPRVRLAELKFTCEAIDELQPLREVEVPLWLALFLKKRDKCQIKPPEWLEVDRLKATLAEERENEDKFSDLPFHYLEMAKLLLANASSDLTDANAIRALLADIEDVRRAKVERGLKNLDIGSVSVKLNGLSAMEVNRIRGIATHALDSMRALDRQRRAPGADDDDDEAPTPARSGGAGGVRGRGALQAAGRAPRARAAPMSVGSKF